MTQCELTMKKNEVLMHATMRMNLENITLTERNQSHTHTHTHTHTDPISMKCPE
jgi:hypothetical protein